MKAKFVADEIKIDANKDEELYQIAVQTVGKKRSKHGIKMSKRVKRARAHEIVYDRFIQNKIVKETKKTE